MNNKLFKELLKSFERFDGWEYVYDHNKYKYWTHDRRISIFSPQDLSVILRVDDKEILLTLVQKFRINFCYERLQSRKEEENTIKAKNVSLIAEKKLEELLNDKNS